jgi:hypothetical protein
VDGIVTRTSPFAAVLLVASSARGQDAVVDAARSVEAETELDAVDSPPPADEAADPLADVAWIEPHGLLQVMAVPYVGADARTAAGDPANVEGFVLRRARLGVDGAIAPDLGYSLWLEFHDSQASPGAARLLDAAIGWDAADFGTVAAGLGKVPFSKGWITEAALLQLPERPFALRQLDVRPIVPDRSLGAWVSGDLGAVNYAAGAWNGSPGLTRGDDNGGALFAVRLEATPLGSTGDAQSAFFAGDTGHGYARVAVGGGVYWNDDAAGDQLAYGADVTFKWRRLSLLAELLQSRFDPAAAPPVPSAARARIDQRALYGQLGFFVLDRLELAGRAETLDRDLGSTADPGVLAFTGGASLYFVGHDCKLMGAYTHRREPEVSRAGQARNHSAILMLQGAF